MTGELVGKDKEADAPTVHEPTVIRQCLHCACITFSNTLCWQVQKKIGECVEELAVKVLQQVGGDEAKQVGGEEEVAHNITCLLALKESAKQLLSARTLL